jgi:hypothetical protein
METLSQIRDRFISNCLNVLKVARVYDSFAHIVPDFLLHPDKLTFWPDMADLIAKYKEMAKMPDPIERMIQAQMIGQWRIFLAKVYDWHIDKVLRSGASHEIKVRLTIEFPIDLEAGLHASIRAKALQEFDRQDYDTQLDTVLRLLGRPVNKSHKSIQFIKKHKVIRDVVQHNRGELRERDIEYLGLSEFDLSNGPGEGEKTYRVGDTVVMTYQEIDLLFKNLREAAESLIPSPDQTR